MSNNISNMVMTSAARWGSGSDKFKFYTVIYFINEADVREHKINSLLGEEGELFETIDGVNVYKGKEGVFVTEQKWSNSNIILNTTYSLENAKIYKTLKGAKGFYKRVLGYADAFREETVFVIDITKQMLEKFEEEKRFYNSFKRMI